MMHDPAREQLITRFGLLPLPGATHVTNAQVAQARWETMRRRWERIQAANEAVAESWPAPGARHPACPTLGG